MLGICRVRPIFFSMQFFHCNYRLSHVHFCFISAQIQVYCYWLMGGLYTSGSDHSRIVGWYKSVQSLGSKCRSLSLQITVAIYHFGSCLLSLTTAASIGFYYTPTSRLSEMSQLICSSLVFIIATALSFSQIPS